MKYLIVSVGALALLGWAICPSLMMNHIDGPLLTFRDGQMHWLGWRERWRVWRGKDDALSLERRLRPDLVAASGAK